jgi:hypothetical protein
MLVEYLHDKFVADKLFETTNEILSKKGQIFFYVGSDLKTNKAVYFGSELDRLSPPDGTLFVDYIEIVSIPPIYRYTECTTRKPFIETYNLKTIMQYVIGFLKDYDV